MNEAAPASQASDAGSVNGTAVEPRCRGRQADDAVATDWTAHTAARAGFTLVEMLVVLTVLALIAALSGPVLGRIGDGRVLDGFEESLRAQLALARATAIRSSRATSVRLDGPGRAFRSDVGLTVLPLPIGLFADVATPFSGRSADGVVRFLPDGRSSGGTIRLERAGIARRITVERLTGAVMRPERGDAS